MDFPTLKTRPQWGVHLWRGNPMETHGNPEVDDWFIGWRDFRQFLLDWQPAVATGRGPAGAL